MNGNDTFWPITSVDILIFDTSVKASGTRVYWSKLCRLWRRLTSSSAPPSRKSKMVFGSRFFATFLKSSISWQLANFLKITFLLQNIRITDSANSVYRAWAV